MRNSMISRDLNNGNLPFKISTGVLGWHARRAAFSHTDDLPYASYNNLCGASINNNVTTGTH